MEVERSFTEVEQGLYISYKYCQEEGSITSRFSTSSFVKHGKRIVKNKYYYYKKYDHYVVDCCKINIT